jgi:hypothetical protein
MMFVSFKAKPSNCANNAIYEIGVQELLRLRSQKLPMLLRSISELRLGIAMAKWTLEDNVNDWVKEQLSRLGLENRSDYGVESAMGDRLRRALLGGAKTKNKTGTGKPDFHVEKYSMPVVIENKLGLGKLKAESDNHLRMDEKSVSAFAVNGAVAYAQSILGSELYSECIAIGIAGSDESDVELEAYYVYSTGTAPKRLKNVSSLDFLENANTFKKLAESAKLTDSERHDILIRSGTTLSKQAKSLNKLMNNLNIDVAQRVVYVSGCLLAMQDIALSDGTVIKDGLVPEHLSGVKSDTERDGAKIVSNIKEFFEKSNIPSDRMGLLLNTYGAISIDKDRDDIVDIEKEVGMLLPYKSSTNKQIFTFIYENIYSTIDAISGHLDIMGEMYSKFLEYALGDGKEIGIVLTPPYVAKLMVNILGINSASRVMDLATGSAGFLIAAMTEMMLRIEEQHGKGTTEAIKRISELQKSQLLGVEINPTMFTLATTNMLLRGDSSANIQKGSSFDRPEALYSEFRATHLLLNPPFSYEGNGMPFLEFGLDHMEKGGKAAIIVQDSAGSGKREAAAINKSILKRHTLLASIKMPGDLFQPNAAVQTSIYMFEVGTPHDFERTVRFIDFRNDGFKRTGRGLSKIDHPTERYEDIRKIFKAGGNAKLAEGHSKLWDIPSMYVEDQITNSGSDWNFEQHQKLDTAPTEEDFLKTVGDYLAWEVTQLLTGQKKVNNNNG